VDFEPIFEDMAKRWDTGMAALDALV